MTLFRGHSGVHRYKTHLRHSKIVKMYIFVCIALLFGICNGQAIVEKNEICLTRYGYYKVNGSCDSYYECKDYNAVKMVCPDGLNFNYVTNWPEYPCGYPADVPCIGRGVSQVAKSTAECPRQYGFFSSPSAEEDHCGQYRLCVEGRAFDMFCPFGLAFNMETGRCDWPELVPSCNADAFLGFTCPPAEYDTSGNPIVTNYSYEGDCYLFFSCQNGRARLLSCDAGLAFDEVTSRCINADHVNCTSIYDFAERQSANDTNQKELNKI